MHSNVNLAKQAKEVNMNIRGKSALITGGGSGIGLACCKKLLHNNVKVAIFDLKFQADLIQDTLKQYSEEKFFTIQGDVTKTGDLEVAFKKVKEKFKNIDIVINSAGIGSERDWEYLINVNLGGLIRVTKLTMEYLGANEKGKGGTLINIASILGLEPSELIPIYSASKAGTISIGRSYGKPSIFNKSAVKVITVCPGFTHTPMTQNASKLAKDAKEEETIKEIKRVYENCPKQEAADVAESIFNVIKDASNGTVWTIDGGILKQVHFPSI